MSGLELAGFILGILGSIEQTIRVGNLLRQHLNSYETNENVIKQLLSSLAQLQQDLYRLENQLKQHQQLIPSNNYQTFKNHLHQTQNMFNAVHNSLISMEQSAKWKMNRFRKATKWAEECLTIQSQIDDALNKVLQINSFLAQNAVIKTVVTTTVTKTEQNIHEHVNLAQQQIIHTIRSHEVPSSADPPQDNFIPYFQKLPISIAAKPNFDSIDSFGTPCTTEGKLKKHLLSSSPTFHMRVFATYGPCGVGKTTCMHMLSHDLQIRKNFIDGIYYVKLGADVKVENIISQMTNIIRGSGGLNLASEMQYTESTEDAIKTASDWFRDKKFLFLVDDVWEGRDGGSRLLLLLKRMLSESNEGAMVFTTRDPNIATEAAEAFLLDYREPHGPESRAILFRHARQHCDSTFAESTEAAIDTLLRTCGGLPVAHSIVGKGVLQYSMRRNVGQEDAWRMYARRQTNLLEGRTDEYDRLYSLFEASIFFLEESFENGNTKGHQMKYCYKEMYRSLCVLEKQEWAPIHMLGCMWNIESQDTVRRICENFVRVGLAEWHHEEATTDRKTELDLEGIAVHDLLHDFAKQESKHKSDTELWHQRVIEGYGRRMTVMNRKSDECPEWWKVCEKDEKRDGGYFMRNLCRHVYEGWNDCCEISILVTRPEWIAAQLSKNGLSQYEADVRYVLEWIERKGECGIERCLGRREIKMIRDAARLSISYICKNSDAVWFQLYGRLTGIRNESEGIKRYLDYIQKFAPRPWLRPIDGLLASVGSSVKRLVDVGRWIQCMLVLPGEKGVLCGCVNGEMIELDVNGGLVKTVWKGHSGVVRDMAISASRKIIVSVSDDGYAKLWEVGKWCVIATLKGSLGPLSFVSISRDENHIFTFGRDEAIRVWNADTRDCVRILKTDSSDIFSMLVLRDGNVFVTDHESNGILVWRIGNRDAAEQMNGKETVSIQTDIVERRRIGVHSAVECFEVSADGSKMVIGHRDGSLQLWDTKSMSTINSPWTSHAVCVTSVAFSRDNTKIASGSIHGIIQVWDVSTGKMVCDPFTAKTGDICSVSFIDEDNKIISCSKEGTVRVWKISPSEAPDDATADNPESICCSPDGSCFVTGHADGKLRVWDALTGQMTRSSAAVHDNWINCLAVTPDCQWIISVGYDEMVKISDMDSLKVLKSFKGHLDDVWTVEISRNGYFAVTGSADKTIRIWDLRKCDGSHGTIELFDCASKTLISADDRRLIPVLKWNRNIGSSVEVWDLENKQLLRRKSLPHPFGFNRDEILNFVGEQPVSAQDAGKIVFSRLWANEILWGKSEDASHSIVLGTIESPIRKWSYSKVHQTFAVLSWNKVGFLTLQL